MMPCGSVPCSGEDKITSGYFELRNKSGSFKVCECSPASFPDRSTFGVHSDDKLSEYGAYIFFTSEHTALVLFILNHKTLVASIKLEWKEH